MVPGQLLLNALIDYLPGLKPQGFSKVVPQLSYCRAVTPFFLLLKLLTRAAS